MVLGREKKMLAQNLRLTDYVYSWFIAKRICFHLIHTFSNTSDLLNDIFSAQAESL
jgi:hypothetical protein